MAKDKLSQAEQRIAESITRDIERVTYCKVCGRPIELTAENSQTYSNEMEHHIHYKCLPAYNAALMGQNNG